jgi:hypothetical protein
MRSSLFRNTYSHSIGCFMTVVLILSTSLQPNLAVADDSNPSVDSACATTFANVSQVKENDNQKLLQCKAGKSSEDGYKTDDALWKVWTAVSAYCTIACFASLGGVLPGPAETACTVANIGTTVFELIKTRQFTSALEQVGMIGMSYGLKSAGNSAAAGAEKGAAAKSAKTGKGGTAAIDALEAADGTEEAAKKKSSSSLGICSMAAMSIMTAVNKSFSSATQKAAVKSALEAIAKYKDNTSSFIQATFDQVSDSAVGQTSTTTNHAGNSGGAQGSGTDNQPSACSSSAAGGNGQAVFQCASSSAASSLPGMVSDPNFSNNFQKTTGIALTDFLANANSPSSAIAAAMSGKVSPSQMGPLNDLLKAIENDAGTAAPASASSTTLANDTSAAGATYSAGGGSSQSASSEPPEPDMMSMMAGIMAQFGPKQPGEANQNDGVMTVIFANQNKSTTPVAEMRTINIFDRITYRYYFIIKKNKL